MQSIRKDALYIINIRERLLLLCPGWFQTPGCNLLHLGSGNPPASAFQMFGKVNGHHQAQLKYNFCWHLFSWLFLFYHLGELNMKYHLLYCHFLKFHNFFYCGTKFLASDKVYAFQKTYLIGILKFNLIIHHLIGVFYHLYFVIPMYLDLSYYLILWMWARGWGNPTFFFLSQGLM